MVLVVLAREGGEHPLTELVAAREHPLRGRVKRQVTVPANVEPESYCDLDLLRHDGRNMRHQ